MVVLTYRYMWQIKDSDHVCFKIVSDVPDGLKRFEDDLLSLEGLERCAKEYLHEYNCESIGKFEVIFGGDDEVIFGGDE